MTYYVEVQQPDGQVAEAYASFETFQPALDWLRERLLEDPERIARARGHFDELQKQALAALLPDGWLEPLFQEAPLAQTRPRRTPS